MSFWNWDRSYQMASLRPVPPFCAPWAIFTCAYKTTLAPVVLAGFFTCDNRRVKNGASVLVICISRMMSLSQSFMYLSHLYFLFYKLSFQIFSPFCLLICRSSLQIQKIGPLADELQVILSSLSLTHHLTLPVLFLP